MGCPNPFEKMGRLGTKKLDDFSSALAANLGWKLATSESLWTRVAYSKYIAPLQIFDWMRRLVRHNVGILIIRKAVLKLLDPI